MNRESQQVLRKSDLVETIQMVIDDRAFVDVTEMFPDVVRGHYKAEVTVSEALWQLIKDHVGRCKPFWPHAGMVNRLLIASCSSITDLISANIVSFSFAMDQVNNIEVWAMSTKDEAGRLSVDMFLPSDYQDND